LDASLSKEAVIDGPSVMAEKVYVLIRNTWLVANDTYFIFNKFSIYQ
jgi:hypothetical protein